jgi:hypothetical protein
VTLRPRFFDRLYVTLLVGAGLGAVVTGLDGYMALLKGFLPGA